MALIDQIRNDIKFIKGSSDAPLVTAITFTTPASISPTVTKTIKGIAVKHFTSIDQTTGAPMAGKTSRVSIAESLLIDVGYPTRNADPKPKVWMKGHYVSFVDSTGLTYSAVITETIPNEMTGEIVCMLGDRS